MNPGSMEAKMAWAFALGGGVLGGVISMFAGGWIGIGLLTAGAFLGTFMTKAGKGAGIGAGLVGTVLYAVILAVGIMMAANSAADEMAAEMAANGQGGGELATAAVGGLGLIGAILGSAFMFIVGAIASIGGAIAGATARPKTA